MRTATAPTTSLDVERVREEFPILSQKVNGRPLVYLDTAASAQKPRAVIDELHRFYLEDYANIHRGVYQLSVRATRAFEDAREKVRRFINASQAREVIFTSGTTASINLVAHSFGRSRVGRDDEVIVSEMEHHSNIVPWQLLCQERGARLRVAPIDDSGQIELNALEQLIGPKTRLLAVTHQSNALGTVTPLKKIIEMAHRNDVPVLVDGAQAVVHNTVDVDALGCDFYTFSGHKLYGPSGIGILYGRSELLEEMPPWQGGGEMIRSVTFERTTYAALPHRFEAGTPNIAGAVGLGAAIDWLSELGLDAIAAHERSVFAYASERLGALPGVRFIGTSPDRASVLSFVLDEIHPHDLGTILDREGIAIRAGHHCAQPVMQRYGVPATARASLAAFNTRQDIDALVRGIEKAMEIFA